MNILFGIIFAILALVVFLFQDMNFNDDYGGWPSVGKSALLVIFTVLACMSFML